MMKFLISLMIFIFMKQTNTKPALALLTVMLSVNFNQAETSTISYMFMIDSLSFWMLVLTLWMTLITTLIKMNYLVMTKLIMMMTLTLAMTFSAWNFFFFFILFEISLILILLIIMAWGYQPERTEAVMFMIIMTMMTSLPFMMAMMATSSLSYWLIQMNMSLWMYAAFMAIFMAKMPVFFFHFWLPKVHVESPVQGSMILAAILLKLGSYGLIRALPIITSITQNLMKLLVAFSLWTTFLTTIFCLTQTDLKTTIAYSSIVHMTVMFLGIMINKNKSLQGSLMVMIGHGMCSSGMFYLANILYKTSKSRSFLMNSGLMVFLPIINFLWFILCMGNTPMPPSLNILGELLLFKSITNWCSLNYLIMLIIMFFSSFYNIFIYYAPTHSKPSINIYNKIVNTAPKVSLISTMHIIPLIGLVTKPQLMMI